MIKFKESTLSKKDKLKVSRILDELVDFYREFYITKSNNRLFIKKNKKLLFNCLSKSDKIAYDENGIVLVIGFSDKNPRKYIKILFKNKQIIDKLLKVLFWHCKQEFFIKVNKNNKLLLDILKKYRFSFLGNRGSEILLRREKQ